MDAGIHMGDMLLGPGLGNLAGHFEDLHVYDFHQRVLVANGLGSEGFTAQAEIVVPGGLVPAAERLVAHRRRHDGPWGWKDPRTTLFLDFWAEMLPEAVFLLVFRRPWEVIDSLFRRGDPSFAWNPPLAAAVWRSYNAALERFHARHPARCVVVELSQVVADPERVIARLQAAVNLPLGSPTARFRDELLVQDADSERACVLDAIDGDILDCYLRLREIAGSESPLPAAVLARGTGTDSMSGGAGADTFLFRKNTAPGNWGSDTVTDFNYLEGDRLLAFEWDKTQISVADTSAGLAIDFQSGGTITLAGVTTSDLTTLGISAGDLFV
ncbi:hypothetical protein EBR56_11940 [bacterium]|nr:hypothetical protein [bacterium]